MNTPNDVRDKIAPDPQFRSARDILIWSVIGMQLLVAIYGFIVLPPTVPIHWGFDGQANGYGPKWIDTFLFPLMSVGIFLLMGVLLSLGPRLGGRESAAANAQVRKVIMAGLVLFLLVVQLAVIAQVLNAGFNMIFLINLGVAMLFIFMGNYMGKLRRNFWMGIRTPWTLTNDQVWAQTHRLGGWLFVAIGVLNIPLSFIPFLRLWGLIGLLIASAVFLCVYSYFYYQCHVLEGSESLSSPFDETGQD